MTTFSCKNEAIYLKLIPVISIVIQNMVYMLLMFKQILYYYWLVLRVNRLFV